MAGRAPERALEDVRERGLASAPIPIEVMRDADLDGRDVLVDAVQLLESQRGAPRAFVAHELEARAPGANERVLGDHEERVDRDQERGEDQLQPVHDATHP